MIKSKSQSFSKRIRTFLKRIHYFIHLRWSHLISGNPGKLSDLNKYIDKVKKSYFFPSNISPKETKVHEISIPSLSSHKINSFVCRYEHFHTDWFKQWSNEIGLHHNPRLALGAKFHRKAWEWCAISQALAERGMLEFGKCGLGFAVGTEPLPALFAKYGVSVLATDLHVQDHRAKAWASSNQHASSPMKIHFENILPKNIFEDRVEFKFVDMKSPTNIHKKYDFIWSSCALEHLGSLMDGIGFIFKACSFLKPGGICVHTTEYNITSNEATIECGSSVIYRRQDIENLDRLLRKSGFCLEKLDFWEGSSLHDRLYDIEPYYRSGRQHIKLCLDGYVVTSMVLVIYT